MKIGIIVYSQTGNTLSVALKLYERLKKDGKDVKLEKIEAIRDMKKNPNDFKITNSPKIDELDTIIFASYVEAFQLCPVMKKYLKDLPSLKNKKVLSFVTQHLSYSWMGGNNANRKIETICHTKGVKVEKRGVINWKNKKREEQIDNLVKDFSTSIND